MVEKQEAILEFTQIGAFVRVVAVDPKTGIEAIIQGPASAGEAALRHTALQKLAYLLRKNGN